MVLLVQEQDAQRVRNLMDQRWQSLLEREGGGSPAEAAAAEGPEPCPACGTAAELVDDCCSDCGLRLAW